MKIKDLIKFEDFVAKLYEEAKIRSPIHLGGTNEKQLKKVFEKISKDDWIFVTWRNHYHWLLSGKDPNELLKQIVDGHSMHVYGDKFFTSAIVGGVSPIALGVALALKLKKSKNKVWCFIGDMAASGGLAKESIQYASGHDLPITYVIEDNGLSVRVCTKKAWGTGKKKKTYKYKYKRKYPHAGSGKWILF